MGNDNVKDYPPYLDYPKERKPPIGAKPGWLCSAQRIAYEKCKEATNA